jgi:hypothetical protein
MKYCVNCQHYTLEDVAAKGNMPELGRCLAMSVISPVTGLPTPIDRLDFCSVKRLPHDKDCGISAQLFKEKEVPNA